MVNKLKVGIAGYGVVGKRRRLFIDQHHSLQTIAVCDRTFLDNDAPKDGVRYYTNYEDCLLYTSDAADE